jgi:signal transduction histidine kinase
MHAEETKIYYTLLIGICTLFVLMTYFLHLIIREHRLIKSGRLARVREDINAIEKEKERIAFELHDDFASSLGTLRMNISNLIEPGERNYSRLPAIKAEIDDMMHRMKNLAHELVPRELSRRGLHKALEMLVDRVAGSSGIRIEFNSSIPEVEQNKSLHIYRIVQEIFNNALKYSEATLIRFEIRKSGGKIRFSISDNGKGFNVKAAAKPGRAGLSNINARTQLMQGDMYITSDINKGTIYEFEIPDK